MSKFILGNHEQSIVSAIHIATDGSLLFILNGKCIAWIADDGILTIDSNACTAIGEPGSYDFKVNIMEEK